MHYKDLSIAYQDAFLIIVDKPAGLLAVPLERRSTAPSVLGLLTDYLRSQKRRPLVVHRIDRDTSGLVVFAKDPRTQRRLKSQFERHEVERIYLAVVHGRPRADRGVWRDRLTWDARTLTQRKSERGDV